MSCLDRLFRETEVARGLLIAALATALGCGSAAWGTDLHVAVRDDAGRSAITVGPGCEVAYQVVGELSDAANDGLALMIFDLTFDGGPLTPANEPSELPMVNFAPPYGFSNPAGYGGTSIGGNLIQVGGAQNVVGHGFWPCVEKDDCPRGSNCDDGVCTALSGLPVGAVITGVGWPGSEVTAATGTLTAPTTPGTYTLQVANIVANVLALGATGDPFWITYSAGVGTLVNLSITVDAGASCHEVEQPCCLAGGGCTLVLGFACTQADGVPQGSEAACAGDVDGDGVDALCGDECPADPNKTVPGVCGCGVSESDSDADTVPDCVDQCPGRDDTYDLDADGVPDCVQSIPAVSEWGLVILTLLLLSLAKIILKSEPIPITDLRGSARAKARGSSPVTFEPDR